MLVTRSQHVQHISTIHVHLRSGPDYEKSRIYEGVLVQVRGNTLTLRNYNQSAALINRSWLAPEAERTVTLPVAGEWYVPAFVEIIVYDNGGAGELLRNPVSTYSWSYKGNC